MKYVGKSATGGAVYAVRKIPDWEQPITYRRRGIAQTGENEFEITPYRDFDSDIKEGPFRSFDEAKRYIDSYLASHPNLPK